MILAIAERVFDPDLDWNTWRDLRQSWRTDRLASIINTPRHEHG